MEQPTLPASVGEPVAIRVLLIQNGVTDRGFLTDKLSKLGFAVRKIQTGYDVDYLPVV